MFQIPQYLLEGNENHAYIIGDVRLWKMINKDQRLLGYGGEDSFVRFRAHCTPLPLT